MGRLDGKVAIVTGAASGKRQAASGKRQAASASAGRARFCSRAKARASSLSTGMPTG
jgi:hypothetical protein